MSKKIKFQFLTPGMHTLVVDNAALGQQKYGLPIGGPMDEEAAVFANKLVGNSPYEPLLEITMIGPSILFQEDCQIALTGANISPNLKGNALKMHETIEVKNGEILKFGKLIDGCRAYLAIRGKWLKSKSSGMESEILHQLNTVFIEAKTLLPSTKFNNKMGAIKLPLTVMAIKGPEYELLSAEIKESLTRNQYTLLPTSNRMGYRLNPALPAINQSIISSGVVPGTLQITENGTPILLMKDGPATGGYLRALVVIKVDVSKLGQLKPGDSLKFKITNS